jgi:hypothetical protein
VLRNTETFTQLLLAIEYCKEQRAKTGIMCRK